MATYWDFRRILNVDPDTDYTCVGIAKSYGRRCTNRIGIDYRCEASQILQRMDGTKSYFNALANLESLADEMLCKGQHNDQSRPHLNQTGEVSRRWHRVAKAEYAQLKEGAERAAKLRARTELSQMRVVAQQTRDELERKKEDMVCVEVASVSELLMPIPTSTRTEVDNDPFVLATRPVMPTTNPPRRVEPTRATAIDWHAVPQHRPSNKIPVFTDTQKEETRLPPLLSGTPLATTNSSATTTRKDRRPEPSFKFEFKFDQKAGHSDAAEPTVTSEPRKRAALNQKSLSTHNSMLPQNHVPPKSVVSFRQEMPSTLFDFEVPSKSQPVAEKVSTPIASKASVPPKTKEFDPETPDNTMIRKSTISMEEIEEQPVTSVSKQPESFGYAIVTPLSTRYKTHLPARQQHGLMTPPETPEELLRARKTSSPPPRIGDYFTNSFDPESPSPKFARKPLLILPASDVMLKAVENQAAVNPRVGAIYQDNQAQSGCLSRFGLKRLRKKVMDKMKNMKERISGLKEEGTYTRNIY